jgi:CRISPR-associated protein Cmr1
MEVKLRTLTPIWTGDSEGVSKSLRETGLIGSLRWWYEALMRARGARVCDPTSGGCQYDSQDRLKKVCAVCRVFGCTGWARTFRLVGEGLQPQPWSVAVGREVFPMHRGWLERIYVRDRPSPQVLWGTPFRLLFLPRTPPIGDQNAPDEELHRHLLPLLRLVERWGALGAKTQNGYGVVQLEPAGDRAAWPPIGDARPPERDARAPDDESNCFNLADFFSLVFEIRDPGEYRSARRIGATATAYDSTVIPCAYDIRYKSRTEDWRTRKGEAFGLRPWLKRKLGAQLGEEGLANLLGSPARAGDRRASRIHVSHLYRHTPTEPRFQLRIWGAVPSSLKILPKDVADAITEFICDPKGMFPGSRTVRTTFWDGLEGGV